MLATYVKTLQQVPVQTVTELNIRGFNLTHFPKELLVFAPYVTKIDASNNNFKAIPKELAQFKELEICFLSNNPITSIDNMLAHLPHLRILGCKSCAITTIAEDVLPTSLQWLILTHNQITALPQSIGALTRLKKVMLAGNQLTDLPVSFAACKEIELLRLSANRFRALPSVIEQLPKLAWFAFGGNPCTPPIQSLNSALNSSYKCDVTLHEKLGEGASGTIYSASSSRGDVAVKCFKGDITSDGYANDEFILSLCAPKHPHILSADAIANTPQSTKALSMPLLPSHYSVLANPPSLQSCTRDCYIDETSMHADDALRIIKEMASALLALHEHHIMHGDFYAHNIQISPHAPTKLGDFGAAFYYTSLQNRTLFSTIESRALAILMHEIIALCSSDYQNSFKAKFSSQKYDKLTDIVEFINKL